MDAPLSHARTLPCNPSSLFFPPHVHARFLFPLPPRVNACLHTQQDKASLVLVGGVETFSDVPIRLTRPLRQALITLPKAST